MPTLKEHFNTCLFFSSAALSRLLNRTAVKHFKVFGLSPTQGFIIMILRKAPGASISVLAEVLALDQTTVSKTIEKMEFMGLVTREPFGRSTRLFLTGKGEEREADAKSAWKKTRLAYTQLIGTGEVQHLCDVLGTAQERVAQES